MNNTFLESPIENQKFLWIATMEDETFLPEYSFDSYKENSFYSIDKERLLRFGLIGYGMSMYFETYGGEFVIAKRLIQVIYKDKNTGKEYWLTGQSDSKYNDIIQFKNAESFFNPSETSGSTVSNITQYNIGYKRELNFEDVKFHFKAICCVPHGQRLYLNLRLVSSINFDNGAIIIRRNDEEFEYDAPMAADHAYEFNWEVQ